MFGASLGIIDSGGGAAAAGAYESIASFSPSSGSSVTFSSIPSTYKSLQIRYSCYSGVGVNISLQFNGDTGSNYTDHKLSGDGSSVTASGDVGQNRLVIGTEGFSSNYRGVGIIDIIDYASTTKNTTARAIGGLDNNGSGLMRLFSGVWLNTSAINEIKFQLAGSTFSGANTISLYGIKG